MLRILEVSLNDSNGKCFRERLTARLRGKGPGLASRVEVKKSSVSLPSWYLEAQLLSLDLNGYDITFSFLLDEICQVYKIKIFLNLVFMLQDRREQWVLMNLFMSLFFFRQQRLSSQTNN